MSRRLLLIYTGGTIGMIREPESGQLRPFNLDQILEQVPEISSFGYEIDAHAFEKPIDSSNMQPAIWQSLAQLITDRYAVYDGFVILHGSDTMAYTASALSFMLQNLRKTVVLTGSQLPVGHVRTDAKENLITSIEIAAAQDGAGRSRVPEVCLYFDYQLFRGNRVIKYNAEKFEAFHSPNYPALAEAGIRIRYHDNYILTVPEGELNLHLQLGQELASLKLFPGMRHSLLRSMLNAPELELLLLEAFGAGNAPTDAWFIQELQSFLNKGKTIVDLTQCHGGSVALGKYETSARLQEIGVVSGFDITFEAALTKGMHLLGIGLRGKQLAEAFEKPIVGELSII